MTRPLTVVGAASSIGIRPYDDGEVRQLSRAPGVLRERGLIQRLEAADLGDVLAPPYRDYVRPPSRARNEEEVIVYSRSLAQRVAAAQHMSVSPWCWAVTAASCLVVWSGRNGQRAVLWVLCT